MILADGASITSILVKTLVLSLFLATQVQAQELGAAADANRVTEVTETDSPLTVPLKG